MGRNRQGLRKLSADLIDQASDKTDEQVVRLMLTFVGTAAFCLLSLASPDSGLLTSNEKLTVPFAGPVSFSGFMLLGPAILIVLRIYLQIYVEHNGRLNRVAQRMPVARAPTLVPLKNPLIRGFSGFTFYLLLPVTMLLFAWKAAVFPIWGWGLLCVTAGVIAGHAMLPHHRVSWRTRALLSVGVAILTGGTILGFGPPRRAFELYRANMSGAWLPSYDLLGADLSYANLTNANLAGANLYRAKLSGANLNSADLGDANLPAADLTVANLTGANLNVTTLTGANLNVANLTGANLNSANLTGANLSAANLEDANLTNAYLEGANLSSARLDGANLSGATLNTAKNLEQQQLNGACGTNARLPPGLTLKPCTRAGGAGQGGSYG
jgi:Pentapeptide repeats (8 copies)